MDRTRVSRWVRNVAIVAAIVLPGPLVARVLLRNDVNVPFEDEWSWAVQLAAMHNGTLTFHALWQAHNAHRILFPTLVALGVARWFGWNVIFESVIGIAFLALAQIPLYRITRDTLGKNWGAFAFVVATILIFSLGQIENIMWGFQIAWFMVVFCLLCVIDVLRVQRVSPVPAFLAGCLCFVAAFSSAFGLLVPIVAVVVVGLRKSFRSGDVGVWAAYAALLAFAYVRGLQAVSLTIGGVVVKPSAIDRVVYVATYIGSPVAGWAGADASLWVGFGGLLWAGVCMLAFLAVAKDGELRARWAPFLAIVVFALGAAAMTAYGRAGLGIDEARSSRYTTLGADFWLALVPMTILVVERFARGRVAPIRRGLLVSIVAACGVLIYGVIMQSAVGYTTACGTVAYRMPALAALRDPSNAPAAQIVHVYPDPRYVRNAVEELIDAGSWPLR